MIHLDSTHPSISPRHFAIFRIILGTYLAVHFAMLIPYAFELLGHGGILPDPSLSPTAGLFPNPLSLRLSKSTIIAILSSLATLALAFAAGVLRPVTAIILWFGWTAIFHRNHLIANASIPYIGLLLLLSAVVPPGESLSPSRGRLDWAMPGWVIRCAWILLAAGYAFSGGMKLLSPSWVDGSAMKYLLLHPLARPGPLADALLELPEIILRCITWLVLAAEISFLPLALWSRSRFWIWLVLVVIHFGILMVIDFADLGWGMLMIHLFTFDPAWAGGSLGNPLQTSRPENPEINSMQL